MRGTGQGCLTAVKSRGGQWVERRGGGGVESRGAKGVAITMHKLNGRVAIDDLQL